MKSYWGVFVVLSVFFLGCKQEIENKALEYVVDMHLENSEIFFDTELHHVSGLDSISFKISKSIKDIKVSGLNVESMKLDSLDEYQNLITLSLNGKDNSQGVIRFTYAIDLEKALVETTGGIGVLLQGVALIPVVKSEIFTPPTYIFKIENESKYHLFSNFTDGVKATTHKVVLNITEKPFDVYKGLNSTILTLNKDSVFVKSIDAALTSVVSYYSSVFDEDIPTFTILVNDFGNHSFYSSSGFVNLHYYNERGVDNKDVDYEYLYSTLYHEVAHKWFSMSNVYNVSPSAFIDEGFSDYVSVMYARKEYGEVYFEQIMDRYKEYANGAVSIMSVNDEIEFDERAKSLYGKGMLFCYEMELNLGREVFVDFLKLLVRERPVNIEALMVLINENYDKRIYDLAWSLLNN